MCFICDGGTINDWLDRTRGLIAEYGFTMLSVGRGKSTWTYTIGLVETFDHPEFVVTGLAADRASVLINDLADRVRDGERFDAASPAISIEEVPLRIGAVHPTQWVHGRFAMWVNYYGEAGEPRPVPAAVQILWPNEDDVFPPDRNFCDVHRDCQPLLSAPVAHDVNRPIGRPRGKRRKKGRR